MWHWVQPNQTMLQLVRLVVRKCGLGSYYLIYLISSWILLVYIATTKLVWSCLRTWCSMTSRRISISNITISGIWCRGSSEALVCCKGQTNSWCVDKAISQSEVWVLQEEAWCSLDQGFLQWKVMSPKAILTSRSDIRAEPFYHGERIWFLPCQIWVLNAILGMEVPGQFRGTLSLGLREPF